jgi:hypothetical protein
MEEFKEEINLDYKGQLIDILEKIIRYEFPKIENLSIAQGEGGKVAISFDEGLYTREEVESKLQEVRNHKFDAVDAELLRRTVKIGDNYGTAT